MFGALGLRKLKVSEYVGFSFCKMASIFAYHFCGFSIYTPGKGTQKLQMIIIIQRQKNTKIANLKCI